MYKRQGLGDVQLNDIVVFNFPAGDTVATGVPNDDVYRLSYGCLLYTSNLFVIHSAFFCTCKLNLMKIGIIVKLLSII